MGHAGAKPRINRGLLTTLWNDGALLVDIAAACRCSKAQASRLVVKLGLAPRDTSRRPGRERRHPLPVRRLAVEPTAESVVRLVPNRNFKGPPFVAVSIPKLRFLEEARQ